MRSFARVGWVWILVAAIAACAAPGPAEVHETGTATSAPESSSPVAPLTSATSATSAPPSKNSAPVPPASASSSGAGIDQGPCKKDADCGWNDPCVPSQCVPHPTPTGVACEETAPAPGQCMCVRGICSLKPFKAPAPTGGCEVRGCEVDHARGTCVADTRGVPENLRTNRHVDFGPSCDCLKPKQGCTFHWYDRVPCKSVEDCWVDEKPRPHPIARPKALRGRTFKPCDDGELPPFCSKDGFCEIGSGFRC